MASAVLATIGAMRASERSIRSAGPAALTFGGRAVDVPPGPGLGIEVDEDAVRGHEIDGYHLDSARSA